MGGGGGTFIPNASFRYVIMDAMGDAPPEEGVGEAQKTQNGRKREDMEENFIGIHRKPQELRRIWF